MKKTALISLFCLACNFVGLQRAAAQLGPPASRLLAPANGVNKEPGTIVVRIYNGAGYFDDALAEQLRPMLAKVFGSSTAAPVRSVPSEAVTASTQPENQKKSTEAPHL